MVNSKKSKGTAPEEAVLYSYCTAYSMLQHVLCRSKTHHGARSRACSFKVQYTTRWNILYPRGGKCFDPIAEENKVYCFLPRQSLSLVTRWTCWSCCEVQNHLGNGRLGAHTLHWSIFSIFILTNLDIYSYYSIDPPASGLKEDFIVIQYYRTQVPHFCPPQMVSMWTHILLYMCLMKFSFGFVLSLNQTFFNFLCLFSWVCRPPLTHQDLSHQDLFSIKLYFRSMLMCIVLILFTLFSLHKNSQKSSLQSENLPPCSVHDNRKVVICDLNIKNSLLNDMKWIFSWKGECYCFQCIPIYFFVRYCKHTVL